MSEGKKNCNHRYLNTDCEVCKKIIKRSDKRKGSMKSDLSVNSLPASISKNDFTEENRIDGYIDSGFPYAAISTNELSAYNNNMVGRILTIVDATGLDTVAKKAAKDLIKDIVYQQFDHVHHWMQYDKDKKPFPFGYSYNIKPSDYQP